MAEDFNHIDQIIRQKFENFEPEPPAGMWEKIQSDIPKNPPPASSSGFLLPVIVTVSLLIFIAGLFYNIYNDKSALTAESPAGEITIQSASLGTTGSTSVSDNTIQEDFYNTAAEVAIPAIASPAPDQPVVASIPVRLPQTQAASGDRKKKAEKAPAPAQPRGEWKPGLAQSVKSGELSSGDVVKYNLTLRDIRKFEGYQEVTRKKFADWSIGFYINPEMTSGSDPSISNAISHNLSILPRLTLNRFFVESGVNVRLTHDKGNMSVDYNRYLGTYEDVYLVTFDSTENGVIPTYHTRPVDVFDTITHYSISETKVYYTYLEVPVLFGYRYNFGKLGLFAKAGPAASFMLGDHVPAASNPEDKVRIINVAYQVPLRASINWQLLAGAGIEYELAGKLSFSLEPSFRFALKSEFDQPAGTDWKTRSFGVRAGLQYKF